MNLLYPTQLEDNSFRKDHTALTSVKALGLPRLLAMEELDILRLLTADPEVLAYRQEIFRDLKENPTLYDILKKLREYLADLRDLSQKRVATGSSTEDVLYSFGELKVFIDMILEITESVGHFRPQLTSRALIGLLDTMDKIRNDASFPEVKGYVDKILATLRFPRSVTLGVNLNARFEPYEVGVVSINNEYYIGGGLFSTMFGKTAADGGLRCNTPLVSGEAAASFSNAIYSVINADIARSLKKARSMMLAYIQNTVAELAVVYDDLNFILRGAEYVRDLEIRKVHTVLPEMGKSLVFHRLINPALLRKLSAGQIISNDVSFPEDSCILLITGPNSGGKSVYVKAVGIAVLTAQLGLPIAAVSGKMPVFTSVYYHFPAEDSADDSRLVEECKAMREILDGTDEHSLILMDESFSGTGSAEGAVIAEEVLKTIRHRRASAIYSTHLHELAARVPVLNEKSPKIVTLSAEYVSGRRTYRVIPTKPGGRSYAYEIARQYGLGFEENT
ncbi:MAG: hypothetical protein IJF78_05115 [Clostridia bacterium]|nr:hypothetical protein [Clostridia bacterium]